MIETKSTMSLLSYMLAYTFQLVTTQTNITTELRLKCNSEYPQAFLNQYNECLRDPGNSTSFCDENNPKYTCTVDNALIEQAIIITNRDLQITEIQQSIMNNVKESFEQSIQKVNSLIDVSSTWLKIESDIMSVMQTISDNIQQLITQIRLNSSIFINDGAVHCASFLQVSNVLRETIFVGNTKQVEISNITNTISQSYVSQQSPFFQQISDIVFWSSIGILGIVIISLSLSFFFWYKNKHKPTK